MSTENEAQAFDSDGIPILTDLVYEDEDSSPPPVKPQTARDENSSQPPVKPQTARSAGELALELLESDTFRQQLDKLAAGVAIDVRQQLEQTLRPIIDVAISHALESGDSSSREVIRQQLEAALPELLAQTLQK